MTAPLLTLCWPAQNIGACLSALAHRAGLTPTQLPPSESSSVEWQAKHLGCEAESVETTFADLERQLSTTHPAVLELGHAGFLAILHANRRTLRVLTPQATTQVIALKDVADAIRNSIDQPARPDYQRLLRETALSADKQAHVVDLLLAEQTGGRPFDKCWILRAAPGAPARRWLRQAHAAGNASALFAAHSAQYLLLLAAWAILGRLSFGRLSRSSLLLWALLLLAVIPFRLLATWLQGRLVVGIGRILKRRLLWGSLRLEPDEVRHQGVGSFLGQALEAEAVETLALSGGIAGLLAAIEILVSAFILGPIAAVLLAWVLLMAAAAWRFLRRYQRWTSERLHVTQHLIEAMVGHRTRLAQLPRHDWHQGEDEALASYFAASRAADSTSTALMALIPRGWLLIGLACLAPSLSYAHPSTAHIGLLLGGVLLAYNAFRRLTASFADVAAAYIAWQRIAPLFHAAARPEHLGHERKGHEQNHSPRSENVIEAGALSYSYRPGGRPALQGANLLIQKGDRILLEGSSGGGKSTFASLLAGLRRPSGGRLLLNGHDRHTLGDDHWRKHVVAAPQFHENHVLTETLAFNVLMGRGWPPKPQDLQDAESMCRELGLGDLLDRMPAGLLQMVGEGGWQLSHGERSRIFVARALLQQADLVILDESFAALDPENLQGALECALRHAPTLMVVAHP